jgi:hypothetical protein
MVSKQAMDAAIAKASQTATANALRIAREINEAQVAVRPWVGDLVAQDSAAAVYKAALETLGVKTAGIHESAFRALLEAQPKPGSERRTAAVAMDAAGAAKTFKGLDRIKVAG